MKSTAYDDGVCDNFKATIGIFREILLQEIEMEACQINKEIETKQKSPTGDLNPSENQHAATNEVTETIPKAQSDETSTNEAAEPPPKPKCDGTSSEDTEVAEPLPKRKCEPASTEDAEVAEPLPERKCEPASTEDAEAARKRKCEPASTEDAEASEAARKLERVLLFKNIWKLHRAVAALPSYQLGALLFLIKGNDPSACDESDPNYVEIDLGKMNESTLTKVQKYVEMCCFLPYFGVYVTKIEEPTK